MKLSLDRLRKAESKSADDIPRSSTVETFLANLVERDVVEICEAPAEQISDCGSRASAGEIVDELCGVGDMAGLIVQQCVHHCAKLGAVVRRTMERDDRPKHELMDPRANFADIHLDQLVHDEIRR